VSIYPDVDYEEDWCVLPKQGSMSYPNLPYIRYRIQAQTPHAVTGKPTRTPWAWDIVSENKRARRRWRLRCWKAYRKTRYCVIS